MGQVKDVQLLQPLFEFSGACSGCGETPYIKLMTQLFGDRMPDRQRHRLLLDLRRQPADHAVHPEREGRGPAWSNSLFEDNAEFGLGMRLAIDKQNEYARELVRACSKIGDDLAQAILNADHPPKPASSRSASA
jgi:pyruvate-ferredoxin/flavodoxin oxidoreductase